jgi:DNA-binding response OmpR family regulator
VSAHRILVVDDLYDAVEATCLLLTHMGHECRKATTGAHALELDKSFNPDLVVLDLGLPDISGYEVARTLRERHGSAIYLAALTGWGQAEDRERSLAAGFDQHLLKPITVRTLEGVIVAAERTARARATASQPSGDAR